MQIWAFAVFKQLYSIQLLRISHCTFTACAFTIPSYTYIFVHLCSQGDLQKPLDDPISIDGWLLEPPPLKGCFPLGGAWSQLCVLADTHNVAQFQTQPFKQVRTERNGYNSPMSNDTRFRLESTHDCAPSWENHNSISFDLPKWMFTFSITH